MKIKTSPLSPLSESDKARFWAKVNKDGPLPDQSNPHYAGLGPCWVWTGYKDRDGYGQFSIERKIQKAHRVSFYMRNGELDPEMFICHRCDNPSCCNPPHLFAAPGPENIRDKVDKGRSPKGEKHFAYTRRDYLLHGESNVLAKITENQVREIRKLYASGGISQQELGVMFGVSPTLIGGIVRRTRWKHIT